MNQAAKVSVWLLIFIAILPQFSETVYTPALPDIAHYLKVSDSIVEYTLSIYLLGMAVGTLFWGRLSDSLGRRPCLLSGVILFIIGCAGCFFSSSIESLMISRFIQALGGSTGSVLGQSIARDAFKGKERGKVFSLVGSAISFSPAIGPILGGTIDETLGWSYIFMLLGFCGVGVFLLCYKNLPETRILSSHAQEVSLSGTLIEMIQDRKILGRGLFIGLILGIMFSYYSEGSFYLIEILNLSPKVYGATFVFLALSGSTGALWSKHLHSSLTSPQIIQRGLNFFLIGTPFFLGFITVFYYLSLPNIYLIGVTLMSMAILTFAASIIASNTLSIALEDYERVTGTASALFGFFYYVIISLVTFFMGSIHNGTLFPMPVYFFLLSIVAWFLFIKFLKPER